MDFAMSGARAAAAETAVSWVLVSFVVNPGDGHTVEDNRITSGMVCADMMVSDQSAIGGTWKVRASTHSARIDGRINAPAIVNLLLIEGRLGVDGTEQQPVQADMGGLTVSTKAAVRM